MPRYYSRSRDLIFEGGKRIVFEGGIYATDDPEEIKLLDAVKGEVVRVPDDFAPEPAAPPVALTEGMTTTSAVVRPTRTSRPRTPHGRGG